MLLSSVIILLGAVSTAYGAAFYPLRQASVNTTSEDSCVTPATVTSFITVPPSIITVAIENTSSVLSSLSRVASIDTVQISDSIGFRPTGGPTDSSTPKFTHSIVVPVFSASEVSTDSSSVYYVSIGPNTTEWDYTPTATPTYTIGITTVTVLPLQSTPFPSNASSVDATNRTSTIHSTRTLTSYRTPSLSYPHGPSGWNSSQTLPASTGPTGTAPGTGASPSFDSTITTFQTISTTTTNVTVLPSHSYGYGSPSFTLPVITLTASASTTVAALGKRQTCTMVYDSSRWPGTTVSWCNNWDGSTIVQPSSYDTTLTPGPGSSTPTLGTPTQPVAPSVTSSSVSSSTSAVIPSSTTSSAAAATASCGESGDFLITFDQLPAYSPPDNDTANFPPIEEVHPYYDHFYWSPCWAYVPPPNEPFPPQNGIHLAECVNSQGNNTNVTDSPAADTPDGTFGAADRASDDTYWFNARSAYVGCDNGANDTSVVCDFVATGYQWNAAADREFVAVTQHFSQPPCPNYENCQLQQILFGAQFTALSSLSFYANVQGQVKTFFVDTIALTWWNSTCAAGLARERHV